MKNWNDILPIVELPINYLPIPNTGCTPFFLYYEYYPMVPPNLIDGNEKTQEQIVGKLCEHMKKVWNVPYKEMKKAISVQAEY